MPDRAVVVPYDPAWPGLYEAEAGLVRNALGGELVALEHVGSTAVPGLAAKPVLDLLAGLRGERPSRDAVAALRALGYLLRSRPGRPYFRKGTPRTHVLHVARHGDRQWRTKLDLRDYLRADPRAAAAYGELKLSLAATRSHAGYAGAKDRFIRELETTTDFVRFVESRPQK
ncbi:MAG TPA: GrpB family protein [Gaiellaceae bacterium]|nr:GrpB family protein [Gaiellaceae bacterium]